jgi:hypothetical protein
MNWNHLGQERDFCVHSNKPWGSMQGGELLDFVDNYHVPQKGVCGLSNFDNERDKSRLQASEITN